MRWRQIRACCWKSWRINNQAGRKRRDGNLWGQALEAGVEMVTFSTFLARCGVGGRRSTQWCVSTGETPVVPVACRNGRDARCPSGVPQRARRPLSQCINGRDARCPSSVPQRARRPLSQCINGRDARCPSRAAWGPAGDLSPAEGGADCQNRVEWRAGRLKALAERRRDDAQGDKDD